MIDRELAVTGWTVAPAGDRVRVSLSDRGQVLAHFDLDIYGAVTLGAAMRKTANELAVLVTESQKDEKYVKSLKTTKTTSRTIRDIFGWRRSRHRRSDKEPGPAEFEAAERHAKIARAYGSWKGTKTP